MALDIAKLVTLRDSLMESRLRGVLTVVDQNGERLTYKSDSEMAAAIAAADAQIAAASRSQPIHTIQFSTSKGL